MDIQETIKFYQNQTLSLQKLLPLTLEKVVKDVVYERGIPAPVVSNDVITYPQIAMHFSSGGEEWKSGPWIPNPTVEQIDYFLKTTNRGSIEQYIKTETKNIRKEIKSDEKMVKDFVMFKELILPTLKKNRYRYDDDENDIKKVVGNIVYVVSYNMGWFLGLELHLPNKFEGYDDEYNEWRGNEFFRHGSVQLTAENVSKIKTLEKQLKFELIKELKKTVA